jgi:hypothetical protein
MRWSKLMCDEVIMVALMVSGAVGAQNVFLKMDSWRRHHCH